MPQGPPRNLRELQARARAEGPMLASSGIPRRAQREALTIRQRARADELWIVFSSVRIANVYKAPVEVQARISAISPTANVAGRPGIGLRAVWGALAVGLGGLGGLGVAAASEKYRTAGLTAAAVVAAVFGVGAVIVKAKGRPLSSALPGPIT